ncbi:MAG: tetratricopeptide repeat protein [Myxococcales bacterium]|nr:tetratricopeptide repeat protein [Myxococcales bacterium]
MRSLRVILCLAPLALAAGCPAQRATRPDRSAREILLEPTVILGKPDAELGLDELDAQALLKQGLSLQAAGKFAEAALYLRRLLSEFPGSRYLSAAAFNLGRGLEELGRPAEAVEAYRRITRELPGSRDFFDAAFREAGCLGSLGRAEEAVALLDRVLQRADTSVDDQVDAWLQRGEILRGRDPQEAERSLRAALRLYRAHERKEYLDPALAARAEFRLAELAEKGFQVAPLRLPEELLESDLEEKARRLLEAQAGFLRCMRHGDAEWAIAAGYRIGRLYVDLHHALEAVPTPEDLSGEEAAVYRELLRKRLLVLLRKAVRVFEMTVQLSERTRLDTEWTREARAEMARIEREVLQAIEAGARGGAGDNASGGGPEPEPVPPVPAPPPPSR